jgi:hypothetical protein
VNETVVKVHTWPTAVPPPAAWKYCEQHWFHNVTQEVLGVVNVLFNHQIDDVKTINFPNHGQHELLGRDLLVNLLSDNMSQCAPFHEKTKFRSRPTLIHSDKSWKFAFLLGSRMGNNSS